MGDGEGIIEIPRSSCGGVVSSSDRCMVFVGRAYDKGR